MKELIHYCDKCKRYMRHADFYTVPATEPYFKFFSYYYTCPCGYETDELELNLDSRNFHDCNNELYYDMDDVKEEYEYAKEEYAEDDIHSIEDLIDYATAMGGD